jgi:hypothetical protein
VAWNIKAKDWPLTAQRGHEGIRALMANTDGHAHQFSLMTR